MDVITRVVLFSVFFIVTLAIYYPRDQGVSSLCQTRQADSLYQSLMIQCDRLVARAIQQQQRHVNSIGIFDPTHLGMFGL